MNFKWNSHQLNTYIYLSVSVIDFRKQYDQLLVILGLSRYQTTGRFPGWKIHIQILPSQCICISDKSLNLYSLITVTRSYRNYTCFPFNRSTFSVSDLFSEICLFLIHCIFYYATKSELCFHLLRKRTAPIIFFYEIVLILSHLKNRYNPFSHPHSYLSRAFTGESVPIHASFATHLPVTFFTCSLNS